MPTSELFILLLVPTGFTLAENGTVALNGGSEYISGCIDCTEYASGDLETTVVHGSLKQILHVDWVKIAIATDHRSNSGEVRTSISPRVLLLQTRLTIM